VQKKIAKIFGILLVIEVILLFGVILTSMTDEEPNDQFRVSFLPGQSRVPTFCHLYDHSQQRQNHRHPK
jgi:hypothetical protein